MPTYLAIAIICAAAAALLGLAYLRLRARCAGLEALQRLGPLTVSRDGGQGVPRETARAVHAGWAGAFQQMIYSAHDIFWETDAEHRYVRAFHRDDDGRQSGFDELIGRAPWDAPAVGVSAESWARLREAMEQQRNFHDFIAGRVDREGRVHYDCLSGVPIFTGNGGFAGYRGASREFTAIRQTQLRLEIRDAVTHVLAGASRLSDALPAILESVCKPLGWQFGARWMRDARNNTLVCGEIWSEPNAHPLAEASRARRFPITVHDLISRAWTTQTPASVADVAQDVDFSRRDSALACGLHAAFAFPVVVQGEVVCVLEFLGPLVQKSDALVDSLAQSLSSQLALFWLRREAEARLTYAATHDALTGLRNRLSFHAEFDRTIARAKRNRWRLALMFIDLDGFKQINDRLGHSGGDKVLIEIAKRLKISLRSSDTLARMGGDEFVVLLEQAGTDGEIAEVAHKLLSVIRAPFESLQTPSQLSASFGIAIYPVDGIDQESLMARADSAMYRAKDSSDNRAVFYRPPASEVPNYNRGQHMADGGGAGAASVPSGAPRVPIP